MRADVAGVEPAAAQRLRRRLRALVVALHHVVAADDDLAALAGRHRLSCVVDDATSTPQIGSPTVPGFDGRSTWLNVATGDVSDSP